MIVLVTGATGFIGQHVIRQLIARGVSVVATSRNQVKAEKCDWYHLVEYRQYDLSTPCSGIANDQLFDYFGRPDKVMHLAWQSVNDCTSISHIETSLWEHYKFLKSLITQGLGEVVVTGTCLEYGMKQGRLSEEMTADPSVAYAIAKDSLRRFLGELKKLHKVNLKWVRLFYMYGEGQHSRSLLAQLSQAIDEKQELFNMSGGEQVRDYLSVVDVAGLLVELAMANFSGIVNCSSGKGISVRDFVLNILNERNSSVQLNLGYYPYKDYEPMEFWGANEKMLSLLMPRNLVGN